MSYSLRLLCCFFTLVSLAKKSDAHSRYDDINHYLLIDQSSHKPKEARTQKSVFAAYIDTIQGLFSTQTPPTELPRSQQVALALQKIRHLDETQPLIATTPVIDKEVWRNLDLFATHNHTQNKTVINALKRTTTAAGEIMLSRIIIDPTTDISLIKKRQQFIHTLLNDDILFHTVENALHEIAEEENNILSLLNPHDMFNQDEILNAYNIVEKLKTPAAISAALNFNFMIKVFLGSTPILATLLSYGYLFLATAQGRKSKNTEWFKNKKFSMATGSALLFTFLSLVEAGNFKKQSLIPRYTIQKLSAIGTFLYNTHELKKLFSRTELPELSKAITVYDETVAKQLETLKHLLNIDTFMPNKPGEPVGFWHYFLSNKGDIANALLTTKRLLPKVLDGIVIIGLLDAYLSIAKLIKERAHTKTPYCFVELIEDSHTPIINATNFYHPILPPEQARLNSLTLGIEENPRNIIISGVNAGGKSTIMKALTLCCILGQSFGIAPAQSFSFTPFTSINTYLNITDDINNEASLFKAELQRAQKLLSCVQKMDPGQLSLTILDEICRGTEHREGEALAYAIAKKLGEYQHSITLIASHFPGLIELGNREKALYKNMKVIVEKDNNTFHYPYILYHGSTTQQIAPDLLEKIGLPRCMTEKMRDVLHNPHSYKPYEN